MWRVKWTTDCRECAEVRCATCDEAELGDQESGTDTHAHLRTRRSFLSANSPRHGVWKTTSSRLILRSFTFPSFNRAKPVEIWVANSRNKNIYLINIISAEFLQRLRCIVLWCINGFESSVEGEGFNPHTWQDLSKSISLAFGIEREDDRKSIG